MNAPKDEIKMRVSREWPAVGSCSLGDDCPHEVAAKERQVTAQRLIEEMRTDPVKLAVLDEAMREITVIKGGGEAAEAMLQEMRDRDFDAGLRMHMREIQRTIDYRNHADALAQALRGEIDGADVLAAYTTYRAD